MVAGGPKLSTWHHRAECLAEEGADVITAGFPCQDISYAGAGAGLAGARSGLVWPLLRTIRLVRPKYAFLENVAALLSRGLGTILGHLAEVGYDAEWHCIPASAVGAPHRRDRIWIIATDAGGEQHQGGCAPFSGALAAKLSATAAYPETMHGEEVKWSEPYRDYAGAGAMADAYGIAGDERWPSDAIEGATRRNALRGGSGGDVCYADRTRLAVGKGERGDTRQEFAPSLRADWWGAEPDVGRVAHGVPSRVDRLGRLGNAIVPQIAELWGEAILEAEKAKEAA